MKTGGILRSTCSMDVVGSVVCMRYGLRGVDHKWVASWRVWVKERPSQVGASWRVCVKRRPSQMGCFMESVG